MQPTTTNERPLGELISALTRETSELVQKEVQLAKAELAEKAHDAMAGALAFSAGAAVTAAGIIVLLFAVVYGMAELMAPWLAALLVGAVALAAGFVLLRTGRNRMWPSKLAPRRTARSVVETAEYVREHLQ